MFGEWSQNYTSSEVKPFLEIFNELSSNGENEVYKQVLVDECDEHRQVLGE